MKIIRRSDAEVGRRIPSPPRRPEVLAAGSGIRALLDCHTFFP